MVLKQPDKIDRFAAETDPVSLFRLASALDKIAEVERRLSDRPLPATKRAVPEKA